MMLKENIIEDYYASKTGQYLSLKKACKTLHIKFSKGIFLANNSKLMKKIDPVLVGSGKRKLQIYSILDN